MQLLEFEVQGFKSLYDCKLTDLQPINVFHGENNVGKSNLLEAMELFLRLMSYLLDEFADLLMTDSDQSAIDEPLPDQISLTISLSEFQRQFKCGVEIFAWNGYDRISFGGLIRLPHVPGQGTFYEKIGGSSPIRVIIGVSSSTEDDQIRISLESLILNKEGSILGFGQTPYSLDYPLKDFVNYADTMLRRNGFYRIHADRRLEHESVEPGTTMRPTDLSPLHPSGDNLKQWLLWASVSRDPGERRAFEKVLRPLFADPPLSLGTLVPVAAPGEPYDLQLETSERSIPIDQLGSGIQQLALLGGMIALSQSWIVAIEEPEINLSWPTQEKLKHILRKMVRDKANPPTQFFLSSHSPVFQFYERYFRVEMVDGKTKVTSVPNERRPEEFTTVSEGQGTLIRNGTTVTYERDGVRVRDGNAVILPEYVLEALEVSQGEAVYFHREGDRMLVLNSAQLEELWQPQDDE